VEGKTQRLSALLKHYTHLFLPVREAHVVDMRTSQSRRVERLLLNLRDLQVKELYLQTGASATEIDMPARAGEVRATLRSGAASVVVRIPENVAAQIHTHGGLSSVSVDTQRFPQVGEGDFRSPDYGMAANRIDLDVETGVGSFRVS